MLLHHFQATKLKQSQDKNKVMQDTIGDLETKIEMSKEMATNKELIKQENLVAASTSDKLAASRAMKQNKQLKNQVEEFEHAIMQLVRFPNKYVGTPLLEILIQDHLQFGSNFFNDKNVLLFSLIPRQSS